MAIRSQLLALSLAFFLLLLLTVGLFYLMLPYGHSGDIGDRWQEPTLRQRAGLPEDFNLVSNSRLWGDTVGNLQNAEPILRWSFLGTVVEGGTFYALVWKSDLNQITRLVRGDEVVPGVNVVDIDHNSMNYVEAGELRMIRLFEGAEGK